MAIARATAPAPAAERAVGLADPEDAFLRYAARLSQPTRYEPDSPTLGVSEYEYGMYKAIHESDSSATELLHARSALPYRACARGVRRLDD